MFEVRNIDFEAKILMLHLTFSIRQGGLVIPIFQFLNLNNIE
ncbi:hypothetical protein SAMN04489724_2901 [Algoriphagus locisalis]|uniref:Uncharacterized protein n=1 Tax=Algoriphagus locisalis TaxID=305507 RepID=A0A1I7C683_9BACT|nr:hypothetical protein SAMN04489724_2901 [Algoriphagus locisalis]